MMLGFRGSPPPGLLAQLANLLRFGGQWRSAPPAPGPARPAPPLTCAPASSGPLVCPTLEQSIVATAALLARGRAWPAGNPAVITVFLAWLPSLAGSVPSVWPTGYVQAGFVAAIGAVRNFLETRLCALREEFWCASANETRDLWLQEYALPDPCDPLADLCTRAVPASGVRCSDYAALAARAGWTIDCTTPPATCGGLAGQALAGQGAAFCGGKFTTPTIIITVHLALSAAVGPMTTPPLAGLLLAGQKLNCLSAEIAGLECLLARVLPAHLQVQFVTV
jgi:hypothetical protein